MEKISTAFEYLSTTQKARAALHRDVRAICSECCHFLGMEVTKTAMEVIAELLYKKLAVYAADLEAFAKHAKRSTINADDVKLLVRRNTSLKSHLNTIAPNTNSATKDKRRKTTVPTKPDTAPCTKSKESSNINVKDKENDKFTTTEKNDESLEDLNKVVIDEIDLTFD